MQDNEIKLIINRLIVRGRISDAALLEACIDLNLENSFCKFQNGIYSALEYIEKDLDDLMVCSLQNFDLKNMAIQERIKLAVKIRLENYTKLPNYRGFLKKFCLFSMLPKNTCFSTKLLYETVSTIWYAIYDNSTDFNYYSKRIILAAVYSSTILVFMNDYSENFTDTLQLLNKRINNVMTFQRYIVPWIKRRSKI
jgi:ubiquinone biosynthesis protein COQ9